jgi:hypothetical protein
VRAISAVEAAPASDLVDAGIRARRIHEECPESHDRNDDQCQHALIVTRAVDQHQSG